MSDRWDEEDELDRDRLRRRDRARERELEPEREPTLGELIESSVRKLVTGMVIAGGLIGLGVWGAGGRGGDSAPDYQMTTSADGRLVYRLETDRGRIIACEPGGTHCWQVVHRGQDLDDEAPADLTPKQNAAAPQPQVSAQPTQPAQLQAPQNTAVPATR
jgi:hypothetical protein